MTDVVDLPLATILGRLQSLAPALRAAGVKRMFVFGSRTGGQARPDSDLDVLVGTSARGEDPGFDDYKVLDLLQDSVGLQVQLTQRELLKPRIAERIADDLIEVF